MPAAAHIKIMAKDAVFTVKCKPSCECRVTSETPHFNIDPALWTITDGGLLQPTTPVRPASGPTKIDPFQPPSVRDFLLFAAIDYHSFREWEVRIESEKRIIFSTKGMEASSVID